MTVSLGYVSFYVDDVEATVSFFTEAFGLERRFVTPEGDYGELATGATVLGFVATTLGAANLDGAGGFTPLDAGKPPVGASVTFVTDDVAGAANSAVAAGARMYLEPVEKPWGQTVCYVIDPNGILIEIGSPTDGH